MSAHHMFSPKLSHPPTPLPTSSSSTAETCQESIEPYPSRYCNTFVSTIITPPGRQRCETEQASATQVHGPGSRQSAVRWLCHLVHRRKGLRLTPPPTASKVQTSQSKPSANASIQFYSAPPVPWVHFLTSHPLPISP